MKEINTDVLVVGAGLVGLVAAHCLSQLKYNVVVIDKKKPNISRWSTKDNRTTAVSEGSKQFLQELFLWDDIKKNAEPIKKIKVFDVSNEMIEQAKKKV